MEAPAYNPDQILSFAHTMATLFSPALTASSSTSFKDTAVPDLTMGQEFDFSQLLNFDDDIDSGLSSHSPTTISPNHTPSPLPTIPSPVAVNPSFELFDDAGLSDFAFDFPTSKEDAPAALAEIKQEPVEFGWAEPTIASTSAPEATPSTMNFSGLPMDQQLALQQLMVNIMSYQSRFGADGAIVPPSNAVASSSGSGTIQPSMVFSASPSISINSSSTSSFVSPAALTSQPTASPSHSQSILEDIPEDEPLRSIGPSEQNRKRSASVMSFADDLDAKIGGLVPVENIFSAGKGKGGKKGGGLSSVVRMEDEDMDDDDSWRPSAEEYKKLSSKEKRQLRNKLSARAFRTRRKDYISTLEGHIKDRDTVIDAMRSELVSSKSENQDLRRELEALKASTMSILHPSSASQPSESPALISALAMAPNLPPVNATAGPSQPRKSIAPTFNPKKDLPSSAFTQSSKGFWGTGNDILGGGGPTICHTALTPDVTPRAWDMPRQNLNPLLNADDHRTPSLASVGSKDIAGNTFAEWTENNAFSLRSMDSYRMQMWSRLAREAQAEKAGLAQELRPKFFVEPKSPSAASTSTTHIEGIAAAGVSHVTGKLAHSFMSAFTGPTGAEWDGDKLAAVVTGKARLRVVDEKSPASGGVEDDLAAIFGGLKLQTGPGIGTRTVGARENPIAAMASLFRLGGLPARA